MTTVTAVQATRKVRPSWRWLLTFAAFPPVGYLAHAVAGPVDAPAAAVLGGVVTGAGLGLAQLGSRRTLGWGAVTAVLWAIGWTISATIGIDVESQYVVFGASGAIVAGFAQSLVVDTFVTTTPPAAT